MVLLPKVWGSNSVDKFHHIMLGNFLFKIVSKILADKLAGIASWIVSIISLIS